MSQSRASRHGRSLRLLIFVTLGMTAPCVAQTEATRELILPSGKLIRVLEVSRVNFNHGTALVLKYQTDLNISDLRSVRKEVDEVWPVFKGDVDRAKLTTAIIAATEVPQGVV